MVVVVKSCFYYEGNIPDRKHEGLDEYVLLALLLGRRNCPAKFVATVFKNFFFLHRNGHIVLHSFLE